MHLDDKKNNSIDDLGNFAQDYSCTLVSLSIVSLGVGCTLLMKNCTVGSGSHRMSLNIIVATLYSVHGFLELARHSKSRINAV